MLAAIMKNLFTLILFFITAASWGQNWKSIPKTKIKFSNFIHPNQDNWYEYSFEYFRKGDSLIGVEKNLAQDFYKVFKETPSAFNLIFKEAWFKSTTLNQYAPYFDTTILKIPFRNAVIIQGRQEVDGHNEFIWILTNVTWSGSSGNPCFINVNFLKSKNKSNKYRLKFLSAKHDICQI